MAKTLQGNNNKKKRKKKKIFLHQDEVKQLEMFVDFFKLNSSGRRSSSCRRADVAL